MKRFVLALMFFLAAWPALAQDGDSQWRMAMWPSKNSCSPEKNQDVSLEDILKAPHSHDGQCVRVIGYYKNRALFLDPDDMVIKYAQSSKETEGRRIGVSGSDKTMDMLRGRYDQHYIELTGIIWQCEDTGPWMGAIVTMLRAVPSLVSNPSKWPQNQ